MDKNNRHRCYKCGKRRNEKFMEVRYSGTSAYINDMRVWKCKECPTNKGGPSEQV